MPTATSSPSTHKDNDVNTELAAVKKDVAQLRDHLGALLDAVKETSRAKANDTRDTLEAELEDAINEIKKRSSRALHAAETDISEKPLTSVACAFGVGFILAKLFSRGD